MESLVLKIFEYFGLLVYKKKSSVVSEVEKSFGPRMLNGSNVVLL
jgi:hypothetical protein